MVVLCSGVVCGGGVRWCMVVVLCGVVVCGGGERWRWQIECYDDGDL